MELKDRIKAARKHAHLSQVQLAQAVGMTQTSISDLERGKSRATSFVAQIAGACGVSDYNYFTKVFKSETQQTPREFRLRWKNVD